MARGSEPLHPPSPAEDRFGKGGAGLLSPLPCTPAIERLHLRGLQSAAHQPFSSQQVLAPAVPLGQSHQRRLSLGEHCKPEPPLALLLPAPAPLLSPCSCNPAPHLHPPSQGRCSAMPLVHCGSHRAGCVLASQLWAEQSSCSVLLHGVSEHQQLSSGWLQEMPPC